MMSKVDPIAPCLALCRPNGYDKKKKRVSFVCRKQCLTSPLAVPNPIEACKYLGTECGYSTHMSIKAHPRLVSEIPPCSDRWKKIRNLRSASERPNGTCKSSDLDILESPRIYGLAMASIEATMACITALLKRVMRFVIGITLNLMRYLENLAEVLQEKIRSSYGANFYSFPDPEKKISSLIPIPSDSSVNLVSFFSLHAGVFFVLSKSAHILLLC